MGKQNELQHHGILGMKWGVRRYQNPDGTLTAAGKARYDSHTEYKYKSSGPIAEVSSTKTKYTRKKVSKMTDQELGANEGKSFTPTQRINAENNYKEALKKGDRDLQDLQNLKSITNDAQQISNTTKQLTKNNGSRNRYDQRKVLTQDEIDAMDNKELQALITRMNLETQYSNLTSDKIPPTTRERISTGLEYTSAILGITGGVLGIAGSIYAIKNNR